MGIYTTEGYDRLSTDYFLCSKSDLIHPLICPYFCLINRNKYFKKKGRGNDGLAKTCDLIDNADDSRLKLMTKKQTVRPCVDGWEQACEGAEEAVPEPSGALREALQWVVCSCREGF